MLGFSPLASAPLGGDIVEEDAGGAVALSTSDITTSAPIVDQVSFSQTQVMGAASVESQAPVVDSVVMDVEHVIVASDILTGNPDISDAVASLNKVLAIANLYTGPPSVGDAAVSQNHVVTTNDLTTGAVDLSTANMAEDETFTTSSIFTAPASVDTAAITQVESLSADEVTTGSPVVDSLEMAVSSVLSAVGITTSAPSVDTAPFSQEHDVSALETVTGDVVVDTANMAEDETFNTSNIFTGPAVIGTSSLQEIDPAPRMNAGYVELDYYDGAFDYSNPIPRNSYQIYGETNVNVYPSQFVVGDITETSSEISFYVYLWEEYVGPGTDPGTKYKRKVTLEKGTSPFNVTLGSLVYAGSTIPSTSLRTSTVDSSELRLFKGSTQDPLLSPGNNMPDWFWEFDQSSSKREVCLYISQ